MLWWATRTVAVYASGHCYRSPGEVPWVFLGGVTIINNTKLSNVNDVSNSVHWHRNHAATAITILSMLQRKLVYKKVCLYFGLCHLWVQAMFRIVSTSVPRIVSVWKEIFAVPACKSRGNKNVSLIISNQGNSMMHILISSQAHIFFRATVWRKLAQRNLVECNFNLS